MTKIKMTEPVAWLHEEGDHIITAAEKRAANATFTRYGQGLITTDQAEAYADARVREQLEIALAEARRVSDKYGYGYYGSEVDAVDEVAEAIRALIPKE